MDNQQYAEGAKACVDTLSISCVVATLVGWLPQIAAVVSIVWGVLRIWETETVRGWTGRNPAP